MELKFYAMGRRRRVSTFVDKEQNKNPVPWSYSLSAKADTGRFAPQRRTLVPRLTANAVKKRPQCTLRRGRF